VITRGQARRLLAGSVLLAAIGSTAACTSAADSLRARDPQTAGSTRDGVLVFRTSNHPESIRVSITVRGRSDPVYWAA
jgi:hypothetical protein